MHTELVDQLEDSLGLDAANMVAMAGAFKNLSEARPDHALVDGGQLPKVLALLFAPALRSQGQRPFRT